MVDHCGERGRPGRPGRPLCGSKVVSFFQTMSAMVARKSEGSLAVVVQYKKARLDEKSRFRDQGDMILLQPSGCGKLGEVQDRDAFAEGAEGDEAWYQNVECATGGFAKGSSIKSTTKEHESYAVNISEWSKSMGMGPLFEKAEADDTGPVFENIKPVSKSDGSMKVMRPELLKAMMSMMAVGDARAPKNLHFVLKHKKVESAGARSYIPWLDCLSGEGLSLLL